jgi:hypothetical protein
MAINTIQSNIKNHTGDNLTNYALFMGGLNVTNDVLASYDPLRTGYGRLFMVRKPTFLTENISNKLNKFKHILEYGNTSIQGINDISVNFNSITGGYAGRSFEIPSVATDDTNAFTVTVYEFSGSPVREVIHTWINGTVDILTGLSHYNGDSTPKLQANQTAEFVYVATDATGQNVEYACFLANCFPKNLKNDHWNYSAGEHNLVEYQIEFTCSKYESLQINKLGQALLDRYKIQANSLNFFSGIKTSDLGSDKVMGDNGKHYNYKTGKLEDGVATNNTNKPLALSDLADM